MANTPAAGSPAAPSTAGFQTPWGTVLSSKGVDKFRAATHSQMQHTQALKDASLAELKERVAKAKAELAAFQDDPIHAENKLLREKLDLMEEVKAMRAEAKSTRERQAQAEKLQAERESKVKRLEEETARVQHKVSDLEENGRFRKELQELRPKYDGLLAISDTRKSEMKGLEEQNVALKEQNDKLQEAHNIQQSEIERLRQDVEKLTLPTTSVVRTEAEEMELQQGYMALVAEIEDLNEELLGSEAMSDKLGNELEWALKQARR